MSNKIAAKGHTHALLALNLEWFLPDDHARERFETLRGSDRFAATLSEQWPQSLATQSLFAPLSGSGMSAEDVGFATGVFRSLMLERLSAPAYALDKSQIQFPANLEDNFQFKTLFKRAWDRWEICVRPTMSGFFLVRLTYNYRQTPRTLIDLAKDAIRLQEPLDVPSAARWLAYNRQRYEQEPEKLAEKERSVKALLAWLGADVDRPEASEKLYYPVQWKVAVEAVNFFISSARLSIPHPEGDIVLQPTRPSLFMPLHDSYIIYHFDELLVEPAVLDRSARGKTPAGVKVQGTPQTVRTSKQLRNGLVNLLEGTVLRDPDGPEEELDTNGYFPSPRWSRADALVDDPTFNIASWSDELCVFTARAALILPSKKWQGYEMAISTVPSATLTVQYDRYWEAIERMIEFVLEVRVLAQLIERDSYHLLTEIAHTVEYLRADLFEGDIRIGGELKEQMVRAAHLRRMAALAQSISHPQYWSRAEFAAQKADCLFELLDVPRIFDHIARNIDGINSAADHVDELYLADLSEKNNKRTAGLSNILAAVSLALALLALPSFWADLRAQDIVERGTLYDVYLALGTVLGFVLAAGAIFVLLKSLGDWLARQRRERAAGL